MLRLLFFGCRTSTRWSCDQCPPSKIRYISKYTFRLFLDCLIIFSHVAICYLESEIEHVVPWNIVNESTGFLWSFHRYWPMKFSRNCAILPIKVVGRRLERSDPPAICRLTKICNSKAERVRFLLFVDATNVLLWKVGAKKEFGNFYEEQAPFYHRQRFIYRRGRTAMPISGRLHGLTVPN